MYKSIRCKNYMTSNIAIKNKPTLVSQELVEEVNNVYSGIGECGF